jgi:hypothetical protein
MAVDDIRLRTRRELERAGLSMESAAYLVDERPTGGWDALVTKDALRAEMSELRAEMSELRRLLHDEIACATWRLAMLVVAAQAVVVAAIAAITTAT